jgi:hypothetical protein
MPWLPLLESSIFILVLLLYPYAVWKLGGYLAKLLGRTAPFIRFTLLSLYYALLLGLAILASGGDPGFGFPAPVLFCLIFTDSGSFIMDLEIFLAWYFIIFTAYLVIHYISPKKQ